MAFFECEFPRTISYKSVGGSTWSTKVNEGLSGFEQRNANWSLPRNKYVINMITPSDVTRQEFADQLNAFFIVVQGQHDAFRLFDWLDHTSNAQFLGLGDGSKTHFQLIKTYAMGGRTSTRTITKPIHNTVNDYQGNTLTNTVKVYKNGVQVTEGNNGNQCHVDATTGVITFNTAPHGIIGSAPADVITADCQFHIPVRFATDEMQLSTEESNVASGQPIVSWQQLSLIEVRL